MYHAPCVEAGCCSCHVTVHGTSGTSVDCSIDTSLYCKVYLRSLGSSAEEIVEHLAEAMIHQYPEMPDRLAVIRKITELADDHEALLEIAMVDGFNLGTAPAGSGMPALRFDSRARGSPLATAATSSADRLRQPAGPPQPSQKQSRTSIDSEIEYLEKRRKLAELERDAASLERDAARANHEHANLLAKGNPVSTEPVGAAEAGRLAPTARKVSEALGLGPAGKEGGLGLGAADRSRQPAGPPQPTPVASSHASSAAVRHSKDEIAAFKKQIEQLEAESRAESGAEQTQNGQMPRGMLCASSTRASDEGTDAASGADLQRALSSRGTELAAAPGPEDGKMAQAKEGMAHAEWKAQAEELMACRAEWKAQAEELAEWKAQAEELMACKARATELTEWLARAEATVEANCAKEHQAKQDNRELREELAEKQVQFDTDRSQLLTDRARLQAELTDEMTEMEAFHKQRLELLAEQKDITAQELLGVTRLNLKANRIADIASSNSTLHACHVFVFPRRVQSEQGGGRGEGRHLTRLSFW